MKLQHYIKNDIYVIEVEGNLSGQEAFAFSEYLRPLVEDIEKSRMIVGMIIDLEKVSLIDSSGIGAIVGKAARMKKIQKKLAISHLNNNLKISFSATSLDKVLAFYSTTDEALERMEIPEKPPMPASTPITDRVSPSEEDDDENPSRPDFMRPQK